MNYDMELMEKQINGFDGFDGSHGFDGFDGLIDPMDLMELMYCFGDGNMRITMIELMVGKWRHIEKFHFVFIPSVFEIFLHLSLLPPKTLRTILIPLFYDIMKISFRFILLVLQFSNFL